MIVFPRTLTPYSMNFDPQPEPGPRPRTKRNGIDEVDSLLNTFADGAIMWASVRFGANVQTHRRGASTKSRKLHSINETIP